MPNYGVQQLMHAREHATAAWCGRATADRTTNRTPSAKAAETTSFFIGSRSSHSNLFKRRVTIALRNAARGTTI